MADSILMVQCPVRLTSHPLQRCGARAIAEMAGRESAAQVTLADLDKVADGLVSDIVRAAVAPKDGTGYDWWKILFALYPNSKPTHAGRSRDPVILRPAVAALFDPDHHGGGAGRCAFCGQDATAVWAKSTLPMFDTAKMINSLPPGSAGWLICRACRICMWALPYGAWVTTGSVTVLSCPDDRVEWLFTRRNVVRARRIQQLGVTGTPPGGSAEGLAVEALRVHAADIPAAATLWTFKNDNKEPWLRVTAARGGLPIFLRKMQSDADCRRGWHALVSALAERDGSGRVTASGLPRAARTLFSLVDRLSVPSADGLPAELLRQSRDISRMTARRAAAWRSLFRLYMEVVHQMDTTQVAPARELLVSWITAEANPRGRFNEYVRAAARSYELQKLLMRASARLLLDGRNPPDITAAAPALLADGPASDGWRLRGLLFFDVMAALTAAGAQIGARDDQDEDEDEATDTATADDQMEEHA